MYLEKHQKRLPRLDSVAFIINQQLISSKYMLNQITAMLDMLKKINTAGVIRICLWQSTGPIIGIR